MALFREAFFRRFAPVRRRFTRAAVIARAAAYLRMHLLCNI